MPKPSDGDKPERGRARIAIDDIATRALGGAAAKLLADAVRELWRLIAE